MATGMPGGIGLPHARSEHVTVPSLGLARVPAGVDFGAPDGPATLVFLIAAPAGGGSEHLTILAALARRLVRPAFRQTIIDAPDAASVAVLRAGRGGRTDEVCRRHVMPYGHCAHLHGGRESRADR